MNPTHTMSNGDDFYDLARDTFGLSFREADEFYDAMRQQLDVDELDVDDLYDNADIASDVARDVQAEPEYDQGDDEYFDVGDEIEVSFQVTYGDD